MISKPGKNKLCLKRHKRIRGKISGIAERPRLSIFRSNRNIYARITDDVADITLTDTSTLDKSVSAEGTKLERAQTVGKATAEAAKKNNITTVIFDRSDYLYRSHIQALTDAAHENGLEF